MKFINRLTYANVTATIALLFAIGGGSAYAANTISSGDIVDGQVKTVDLGPAAVTNGKLADNAVGTGKIIDGAVTAAKLAQGSVGSTEVINNALTGADIDESSLNLPATTAGTFSNRLTVPVDPSPSGQTVLAVPGLGEARVHVCNGKSVVMKFVNTSAAHVDVVFDRSTNDATAPTDPAVYDLAPGGETGPPAAVEGTERDTLQVGSGTKLATITLTGWTGDTNCHFQGMAVVRSS
jgi:hypothetical protein